MRTTGRKGSPDRSMVGSARGIDLGTATRNRIRKQIGVEFDRLIIPTYYTAARPISPASGDVGINSSFSSSESLEWYDGVNGRWANLRSTATNNGASLIGVSSGAYVADNVESALVEVDTSLIAAEADIAANSVAIAAIDTSDLLKLDGTRTVTGNQNWGDFDLANVRKIVIGGVTATSGRAITIASGGGGIRLPDNEVIEWGGSSTRIFGNNSSGFDFRTSNVTRFTIDGAGVATFAEKLGIMGTTPGAFNGLYMASGNYLMFGTGSQSAIQGHSGSSGYMRFFANLTENLRVSTTGVRAEASVSGHAASTVHVEANPAATPDDAKGLGLINGTAATLGAQKFSPMLRKRGGGWGTTLSQSTECEWREYVIPVQGLTPTVDHVWESRDSALNPWVEKMRWIGATELLDVGSATLTSGIDAGVGFMGSWVGASGFAAFAHQSVKGTSGSYTVLAQSDGTGYVNAASGKLLHFRINNSDVMKMDANGLGFGAVPGADAAVRITSTTQGFGKPSMTTAQRNAIASPADGLEVWNNSTGTTDTYDAFLGAWAASV